MVTTLYLIRHGATEGSERKAYKGSIDVPLSKAGEEQVRTAADFVSSHLRTAAASKYLGYLRDIHGSGTDGRRDEKEGAMQAVYCSDLSRAVRSAEIIAGPHNVTPVCVEGLRERSFGIWEGMTFLEIKERYPAEFQAWASDPVRFSPMEGESTIGVSERVMKEVDSIIAGHKGENIAIVAHGGVNRIILCHTLGMPLEHIFRIEQDYAAVNVIEFWDRYPVVKLLNGGPYRPS